MSRNLTLPDAMALGDLRVFLGRAARVDDGSARLIAVDGVLAVYVAVFYPVGLLDQAPTILGLRTFAVQGTEDFDTVVRVSTLAERLTETATRVIDDTAPLTVALPPEVTKVSWAAISPPRGGWVQVLPAPERVLQSTAADGIAEVAQAIPTGTGEQIVHRVRSEVWGRPIVGLEHVMSGGAFAALSLGFLGEPAGDSAGTQVGRPVENLDDDDRRTDVVRVYATGPWTRLTTPRGHVLIKSTTRRAL